MKTFDYTLTELLGNGLRPLEESPREGNYMTALSNGRPTDGGLVQADTYTRSFALDEEAQLFRAFRGMFVLTQDTLYSYNNGSLDSLLSGLTVGGRWSMADFGDYVLFTNGEINLIRDPATGIFSVDDGTVFPLALSICAHRGRLILGGPKNYPDSDNHDNWVAWSDINNLKFISSTELSQARQNLSGYTPMAWESTIYKILPLGNKVIVYGDNGITALPLASTSEVASTYGREEVHDIGISSAGSVIGDKDYGESKRHFFIDTHNWLYELKENLELNKLGYKEFLS